DVQNRVSMISRMLLGRPNLERVAQETGLAARTRSPGEFASLVAGLSQSISLEGSGGGNIYTLTYSDADPKMAERVVHTLLDTFMQSALGEKRADTDSAQQFLMSQIREYEGRLRNAEDRLAEFKKRNVGLMPGETGDYYTRMQAALAQLDDLRSKYRL